MSKFQKDGKCKVGTNRAIILDKTDKQENKPRGYNYGNFRDRLKREIQEAISLDRIAHSYFRVSI